jgi:hypothetical protein
MRSAGSIIDVHGKSRFFEGGPTVMITIKSDVAWKTVAAALTLSLVAGNAAAGTRCASAQDVTAMQIAALRQQLTIAALASNDSDSFNRFAVSLLYTATPPHQRSWQLAFDCRDHTTPESP